MYFVFTGDTNYNIVKEYVLNPKSVSLGELYGEFDLNTNEWTDGILSSVMRVTCSGMLSSYALYIMYTFQL